MDYGIKVSQDGYGIDTTDATKLIFETNSNLLKVRMSGATTFNGATFASVTHGLGYVPQFLVYIEDVTTSDRMRLATAHFDYGLAKSDTTKLYFYAPGAGTYKVYYYVFYEPADTGTAPAFTPTSDYGIKVSKDGFGVKTANILQQSFNSEKNCLKIAKEGNVSYTGDGGSVTVAHDLAYIPAWMAWYEVDNSGSWFPQYVREQLSGKSVTVYPYTDGTNFVADIAANSSATVKVHYILFIDPGQ